MVLPFHNFTVIMLECIIANKIAYNLIKLNLSAILQFLHKKTVRYWQDRSIRTRLDPYLLIQASKTHVL